MLDAKRKKPMRCFGLAAGFVPLFLLAQSGPVPDNILYWAVFQRIAGTKAFADKLASEQKNDAPMRNSTKKEIGLTDAEYAAVEAIAFDYLAANQKFFTDRTQALQVLSGLPPNQPGQPPNAERQAQAQVLQNLETEHNAQATSHIAQLHTALGEPRFQVLDQWARKTVLPSVGYKQMQKGHK